MAVSFDPHPIRSILAAGIALAALALARPAPAQVAVTTHHNDAARTGWNPAETALTTGTVSTRTGPNSFGLLRTVPLDGQVDAQPLVAPGIAVKDDPDAGAHDVVYVATEANTVYAINPDTGAVLLSRNFGAPVSQPLGCTNNDVVVGIDATPVIDLASNSLFVMTYTNEASRPTHTLRRLSLSDLTDLAPPRVVTASAKLTDGGTTSFDATYQRHRSALLLDHGTVYAAFASFCDFSASKSRGWLLGWNAATLAPLPGNTAPGSVAGQVMNHRAASTRTYFLSSIWMSGAGPAADSAGTLFAVTGNSDPRGGSYTGSTNVPESVIAYSPATRTLLSLFTPYNLVTLEQQDNDFGSGGVMLLPKSVPGLPDRLAAAAGKEGWMYLMNRDSLGGYSGPAGPDKVVGRAQIGPCWCAPSYFEFNGAPRIVSSGGKSVQLWSLNGGGGAALTPGLSATFSTGQEGGVFTSVSSNGALDPIIWAVSRPIGAAKPQLTLYAIAARPASPTATALPKIFIGTAGTWPKAGGNANIVPTVANGRVYVASYRQLSIFGLGDHSATAAMATAAAGMEAESLPVAARVSGRIESVVGSALLVRGRAGLVEVDAAEALAAEQSAPLRVGAAVTVEGERVPGGALRASSISRAKPSAEEWPQDG